MEENFSTDGFGEWFRDDASTLHLLCAFYFYYISSISDHQALDPQGWGLLAGLPGVAIPPSETQVLVD